MSNFEKKTWVDRVTSYPLRRLLTLVRDFDDTNTAVMDIERAEGNITEEGDAFSAENMNDLEDRIDEALDNVSIDVDSALSTTSTNPVQNKVITDNLNIALDMIRDSSSDAYSSSKAYSVGDYVIYNNTLYKCITACSAGSWSVNSSCFKKDTLTNVASTLTSNLTYKTFTSLSTNTSFNLSSISFHELIVNITESSTSAATPIHLIKGVSGDFRAGSGTSANQPQWGKCDYDGNTTISGVYYYKNGSATSTCYTSIYYR